MHISDVMNPILSVAAIIISLYTLLFHRRLEHETSTQTMIHDQYELCRVLDLLRVEHPDVSHMLALPAEGSDDAWRNYELLKRQVRKLLEGEGAITDAVRGRTYLKEHATALHVCDIYEQTLLQRGLAEKAHDKTRFEILDALVKYYETKTLRGPRFRYHWDHGASDMLEESTLKRFDAKVRNAYPGDRSDPKSPLDD